RSWGGCRARRTSPGGPLRVRRHAEPRERCLSRWSRCRRHHPAASGCGHPYIVAMSMSSICDATRSFFSQQLVDLPRRTTVAAILTIGVGSGWAGSAVIGGWVLGGVGFPCLFYLSVGLALTECLITWGYQTSLQTSMHVSTYGSCDR